jgi:hypothetical protein
LFRDGRGADADDEPDRGRPAERVPAAVEPWDRGFRNEVAGADNYLERVEHRPDGDLMTLVMKILSGWFLLSVPIALLVGRFLRAVDRPGMARIRLQTDPGLSPRHRAAS